MTARIEAIGDGVVGAPGTSVRVALHIDNDHDTAVRYTVRLVGLDDGEQPPAAATVIELDAGTSTRRQIDVEISPLLGPGEHAAAFEVRSDRPGDRAQLIAFEVTVASVEHLLMTAHPQTVRARRRARVYVSIADLERGGATRHGHAVDEVGFSLEVDAPDPVTARVRRRSLGVGPGGRRVAGIALSAPLRWSGEDVQHSVVLTAHGPTAATSQTVAFVQRPVFTDGWRSLVAAVVVIALFTGGFALWQRSERNQTESAAPVDIKGSGIDEDGDGFLDPVAGDDSGPTGGGRAGRGSGQDKDGDGYFDEGVDSDGNPLPGGQRVPQPDEPSTPSYATVSGTVDLDGSDDITAVKISTKPIDLGAAPAATSRPLGFRSNGLTLDPPQRSGTAKLWPDRASAVVLESASVRRTEPLPAQAGSGDAVREVAPDADGVWLVGDVLVGQSHEFLFAKEGFDKQSFVLTPLPDGAPVELDVELEPASGQLGGTIRDASTQQPLGGVEISVSDGTLTFETTTASRSEADNELAVGEWRLLRVSTPSVYTVTARLAGYGTEVAQVDLGEEESDLSVDLELRRGVGSIGGRVIDVNGGSLGGVVVTATSGAVTRTTTTQTAGVIGSYNLPQLPLDVDYIVTAERADLIPQSRSVPRGQLGGDGVNFVMVGKTNTLTGIVTSAATGRPIPRAGVRLVQDTLEFRTTTVGDGTFTAPNLPPGDYVVTVEHYLHEVATVLTTIRAGSRPPRLAIVLTPIDGEADIGRGALAVTVLDEDTEARPRELSNAWFTLTPPGSDTPITYPEGVSTDCTTSDDTRFTGTFTARDLEIGVHDLEVFACDYGSSARRVEVPRSVNGSALPVTVELQKRGSAIGTVVDALVPSRVLSDYSVTLFRTATGGVPPLPIVPPQKFGPYPAKNIVIDNQTVTGWGTGRNELAAGTWQVKINEEADEPPGYLGVNVDVQTFVISDAAVVEVEPIEVRPYPTISGRVFKPELVGADTSFTPIDDASLAVKIECPGGEPNPYALPAQQVDPTQEGPAWVRPSAFRVDKIIVRIEKLATEGGNDCVVVLDADGFVERRVELDNLAISDGTINTDRTLGITMVPETSVTKFGGRLFWVDQRARVAEREVPLRDVEIIANAVVDFPRPDPRSTDRDPPSPVDPSPPVPRQRLTDTTGPDGTWGFNDDPVDPLDPDTRQIFERSTYEFDAAGFGDSTLVVEIDEDGRRILADESQGINRSRIPTAPPYDELPIELTPPDNREISGTVGIITTVVKRFDDVLNALDITGPVAPPAATGTWPVNRPAADTFVVPNAPPGTWTVGFTPLAGTDAPVANHVFKSLTASGSGTSPCTPTNYDSSLTCRLEPGTDRDNFDFTLVELGRVDVVLNEVDNNGNPVLDNNGNPVGIDKEMTIGLVSKTTGFNPPDPVTFDGGSGTDSNLYSVSGIEVRRDDLISGTVDYDVVIEVPGYDTSTARVSTGTGNPAVRQDAVAVTVENRPFQPGTKDIIELDLVKYSSITGQVLGDDLLGNVVGLDRTPVVTATRKFDLNGSPVDPRREPAVGIEYGEEGRFAVIGPPGYYDINVSHPEYQAPKQRPTGTIRSSPGRPLPFVDPFFVAGLFLIEDDPTPNRLLGDFVMEIRTSSLDLTVLRKLDDDATRVETAWYSLSPGLDTVAQGGVPLRREPVQSGEPGRIRVDGLPPGEYTLEVRGYANAVTPSGENSFAAIATITIGRTTADEPSVRMVRAPLPSLAGDIVGVVRAVNKRQVPVPVAIPASVLPVVTDVYATQSLTVDDDTEYENRAPSTTTAPLTLDPADPNKSYRYRFSAVATGQHTLSVPTIGGFDSPPAQNPKEVSSLGDTPFADFVYVANDTVVTFDLAPTNPQHSYETLTVELEAPSGARYTNYGRTGRTITIAGVSPEDGDWTLTLEAELHARTPKTVAVPIDLDGNGIELPGTFVLPGTLTRLTGRVEQNPGDAGAIRGLDANGEVTITPVDPAGPAFVIGTTDNGTIVDGDFSVDVPPGKYLIEARNDGDPGVPGDSYVPSGSIAVVPSPLVGGTIADQDTIRLAKFASLRVNVTNAGRVGDPQLRLVATGGPAVGTSYDPVASTAGAGDQISFDFEVPPIDGPAGYHVEFFGTGYDRLRVSLSVIVLTTGVNTTAPPITLPRQLKVFVETSKKNATVVVPRIGDTDIRQNHSSAVRYLFLSGEPIPQPPGPSGTQDPITGGLPATGELLITLRAGGTVQRKDIPAGNALGATLTEALTEIPVVNVRGNVLTTAGDSIASVPDVAAKVTVKATGSAVGDLEVGETVPEPIDGTVTINDDGTMGYEVVGLSTTSYGEPVLWAVEVSGPGLGAGATPNNNRFRITSTSTTLNTQPKSVRVEPREVPVVFTITGTGDPITGSKVTVAGLEDDSLDDDSTLTVNVPENTTGTELIWEVTGAANYAVESAPLAEFWTFDSLPTSIQVPVVLRSTRITGNVRNGAGDLVNNAVVLLCPLDKPGDCGTAALDQDTAEDGTFSLAGQPEGTYRIFARNATNLAAGGATVTVGSDGLPEDGAVEVTIRNRTITGTVTRNGAPVTGATVKLCPTTAPPGDCANPLDTDETVDGEFTLTPQAEGTYPLFTTLDVTIMSGDPPVPTIVKKTSNDSVSIDVNGVPVAPKPAIILPV